VPQQHYQPRHQQHHQGGEDEGSAAAAGEDKEGPAGAGQAQQPRLNDADARKVVKQVAFLAPPRPVTSLPACVDASPCRL